MYDNLTLTHTFSFMVDYTSGRTQQMNGRVIGSST